MWLPKLRELKEAITVLLSPRFTTKFPAEPCQVPECYRGKPEFDDDNCIGCGACVNVCPTEALTQIDEIDSDPPLRKIISRYDTCIFCGNCQDCCTTEKGIKLTNEWDLATLDRQETISTQEYELQLCEKCNAVIGTKKHLLWLTKKLGPLAYTNPSLLLTQNAQLEGHSQAALQQTPQKSTNVTTSDFMKILCPQCKCELNIQ
ncbi:MAG: 4Fe-4S binding protein, partial [Deltaproteobacteria bacterium]|nr:4Fe-4S binding protein [Deltaproteobacteria bacterium]